MPGNCALRQELSPNGVVAGAKSCSFHRKEDVESVAMKIRYFERQPTGEVLLCFYFSSEILRLVVAFAVKQLTINTSNYFTLILEVLIYMKSNKIRKHIN